MRPAGDLRVVAVMIYWWAVFPRLTCFIFARELFFVSHQKSSAEHKSGCKFRGKSKLKKMGRPSCGSSSPKRSVRASSGQTGEVCHQDGESSFISRSIAIHVPMSQSHGRFLRATYFFPVVSCRTGLLRSVCACVYGDRSIGGAVLINPWNTTEFTEQMIGAINMEANEREIR